MSLTFSQARDEMTKQVADAWTAGAGGAPLYYDDRPGQKPPTTSAWGRLTVRHNLGDQTTLSNPLGQKLFRRDGILTVQVFTPAGAGLRLADTLAKVVADALEGQSTPGGVWFRKVRIKEEGPDGAWYQLNVVAEFEYSEAK